MRGARESLFESVRKLLYRYTTWWRVLILHVFTESDFPFLAFTTPSSSEGSRSCCFALWLGLKKARPRTERRGETKTFIALPKCWLHTRRIEKGLQCAVLWKIFVGCFSNILVVSCKIFRHGIEKFKKPTRSTRFEYECWFSGSELPGKFVEFIILRSCVRKISIIFHNLSLFLT